MRYVPLSTAITLSCVHDTHTARLKQEIHSLGIIGADAARCTCTHVTLWGCEALVLCTMVLPWKALTVTCNGNYMQSLRHGSLGIGAGLPSYDAFNMGEHVPCPARLVGDTDLQHAHHTPATDAT